MKTAVVYARYSSDRQNEQSIEGQLRVCQEYAKQNNITIVETYIDRAMTGTNDNRKDFQRMLRDSNKRLWDYVLVYKLDRFSRNKYEMATHKKTLRDNGIRVVSAMENIPDTPEGIILESLLEGMAEYYSAELSQKVKRGMNESRLKGNFTGGKILFGYKVENKKLIIDEEKADIIRFIYDEYAHGTFIHDIIDKLTKKGVLNRGKPFAMNTVYNILKNERYSGVYHLNGVEYTNIYPKIVSEEIFAMVQKKAEKNSHGSRSGKTVYLLKHKIKCGCCGKDMGAECGTGRNGIKKNYYTCLGRKGGENCKKTNVCKELLEKMVIDTTLKVLSDTGILQMIADKIMEFQEQVILDRSILNFLMKEEKEVSASIENMLKAIELGVVTDSTTQRLKDLEQKKQEILYRIDLEKSQTILKLSETEVVSFFEDALRKEPLKMINAVIKEIVLHDDRIEITYNYTNKKSPDFQHQGFIFYEEYYEMKTVINQYQDASKLLKVSLVI